ncbi:MAG TPA: class I SAM-dependent methyltransferase [Mycobacteriales bacterium]|nr:class I SAM-dependent methyltransferase [Mycobacteriales bacterium]
MKPLGAMTRGTTAARRLRHVDSWLFATHRASLTDPDALVVDLGFGASPVTTLELARGVHRFNPTATVVGLDIDPERVSQAQAAAAPGVRFDVGGFELAGLRPHVVRAFNVLRQYDEADVAPAWTAMSDALAPCGLVVEGTCDEAGRLGAWVTLDATGPLTLTLRADLARSPIDVATRLPKSLIHRNVAGERVHEFLAALQRQWTLAAAYEVFGARQRFVRAVRALRADGWPLRDGAGRWRHGELTVAWSAVAPNLPDRMPTSR